MSTIKYNKTQLHPEKEFSRHIFHRDQFAHYLRWSHVLKIANREMNVYDIGCGNGNLCELMYRNRYKCNLYYGVDIRKKTIDLAKERFSMLEWAKFDCKDICVDSLQDGEWDIICCFEVVEHIQKHNIVPLLKKIHAIMKYKTVFLLSTPVFDEHVGAANNHIINDTVCECTHDEMKSFIEEAGFTIKEKFGTFASQKDYKAKLKEKNAQDVFDALYRYYDSNMMSVIFAPMFAEQSRNILWRLMI